MLLSFLVFMYIQVMSLASSLQLPLPVLVILSPSHALLVETQMGTPSGEWMGTVSVLWYTDQLPPLFVDQVIHSQLDLELGLEEVLLLTHQH